LTYFKNTATNKLFLERCKKVERAQKMKSSQIEIEQEVEIATNKLVGDQLREKRENRKVYSSGTPSRF
jgi:hypothetical protein